MYNEFDLDDFFDFIDITGDGMLSKGEIRNYLKKYRPNEDDKHFVQDKKLVYPDEDMRKRLGLEWEWVPEGKEG